MAYISSEEVKERIADSIAKMREEEARKPRHGFKKRQYIWIHDPQYNMTTYAKVIDCSETILLVKNIEYGGIAYRIDPKDFPNLKLMTKQERRQQIIQKTIGVAFSQTSYFFSSIYRFLNLQSSRNPQTFSEYFANWLSFFVILFSRLNDSLHDKSENTFKGLTDSGPLWPKQKQKD